MAYSKRHRRLRLEGQEEPCQSPVPEHNPGVEHGPSARSGSTVSKDAWLAAAATFWIVGFGLMPFAGIVVFVEAVCSLADGCLTGPDATIAFVPAGLIGLGLGNMLLWRGTTRRPRVRRGGLLVVGVACLLAIVAAATVDPWLALVTALWTGWPAAVFTTIALRRLPS